MSWRFYFRPRWFVGHVIIILMVVLMVNLGFWQLRRLHEQQAFNRRVLAAERAEPLVLTSATFPAEATEYRNVSATGVWDVAHTVYVRYPIFDSQPGYYVIAPLKLVDGERILVNRGWIPVDQGKSASVPAIRANQPVVTVNGLVRTSEHARGPINHTAGDPAVPTITAVDIPRLAPLLGDGPVASKWVQLRDSLPEGEPQSDGSSSGEPRPLPPPEITEGSHFSYTLQWFAFSITIVVGWLVLLRRARRDELSRPEKMSG